MIYDKEDEVQLDVLESEQRHRMRWIASVPIQLSIPSQMITSRVKKTSVRGELVYDDGEIVATSGHGDFLAREVPDWARIPDGEK